MIKEGVNYFHDRAAESTREAAYDVFQHILTAKVEKSQGLYEAEEHLRAGKPLLIAASHFSRLDPVAVLGHVVFKSEVMRGKKLTIPVARHQLPAWARNISKWGVDVNLMPIVTEETLARSNGNNFEPNNGEREYAAQAMKTMQAGGIVLLTPQGTRNSHLPQEPKNHAIGRMVAVAKRGKINNLGMLFVGVGIAGVEDYSDKSVRGFNIRKPFRIKTGAFVNQSEAIQEAGSLKELDSWAYTKLREVVPKAYLPLSYE